MQRPFFVFVFMWQKTQLFSFFDHYLTVALLMKCGLWKCWASSAVSPAFPAHTRDLCRTICIMDHLCVYKSMNVYFYSGSAGTRSDSIQAINPSQRNEKLHEPHWILYVWNYSSLQILPRPYRFAQSLNSLDKKGICVKDIFWNDNAEIFKLLWNLDEKPTFTALKMWIYSTSILNVGLYLLGNAFFLMATLMKRRNICSPKLKRHIWNVSHSELQVFEDESVVAAWWEERSWDQNMMVQLYLAPLHPLLLPKS